MNPIMALLSPITLKDSMILLALLSVAFILMIGFLLGDRKRVIIGFFMSLTFLMFGVLL